MIGKGRSPLSLSRFSFSQRGLSISLNHRLSCKYTFFPSNATSHYVMAVHNLYINICICFQSERIKEAKLVAIAIALYRVAQNGINLDQYPFYLNHISWHKGSMPKYRNELSLSPSVFFPVLARSATLSENLDFTQNFYPHHILAAAPLSTALSGCRMTIGAEKNYSKGWVNRLKCVQINKTSVQTAERLWQLQPLVIKSQIVKSNHSYPKI